MTSQLSDKEYQGSLEAKSELAGPQTTDANSQPSSASASSARPPVDTSDRSHSGESLGKSAGKLFVGQIPPSCREADLHSIFSPFEQLDHLAEVLRGSVLCWTNYGLIASTSLLQVKFAEGESSNQTAQDAKLFVGNLVSDVSEQELKDVFSPFGPIVEVVILRHMDGSPKGSGFVRYRSMAAAQAAIDATNNRHELRGRLLSVSFADAGKSRRKGASSGPAPLMASHSSASYAYSPYERPSSAPYGQSHGSYPAPSSSNYYPSSSYGNPVHTSPFNSATNFDSVIQSIEARLASTQPPPPYPLPSSSSHYAATVSSLPNHVPLQQTAAPSWGPSSDSLLAMMMPRPSAPPSSAIAINDPIMKLALGSKQEGPRDSNLFVLHFPREWGNADLYQAFAPYGRIVSAHIFLDKDTGESRCFGFVSFDNPHSAQAAVSAMNGLQLGNKRIKVELKRQTS